MRKTLIRFLVPAILAAAFPITLASQTVSASPTASFPLGDSPFAFSAGASVEVGLPLGAFELSPRLGWTGLFLKESAGRVDAVTLGAEAFYPLLKTGQMALGPMVGAGAYAAFYPETTPLLNPSATLGLRFDARVGTMRLGLEPSAELFFAKRDGKIAFFWSGIGIRGRVGFEPGGSSTARPRLRFDEPQLEPFFPSFYKYYASGGLGKISVENEEKAAIRDLSVQVFVPRYMDGPQTILALKNLKAGDSVEIPLAALFRNEVLSVTETDAAQIQLSARYRRGNDELEVSSEATLKILGRNAVSWDDDRKAAAFVTAKDPTILKLGRNVISGIPVENPGPGDEALRKAAAVFSALSEFGLRYVIDPASSYKALSANAAAVDYLQFPVQTLDYRSGDCDDLTVLYSALLEAIGVETAFVTVPGHIYSAFALGLSEAEMRSGFSSLNDFVIVDGKVWVPIETTLVNKGFLAAWAEGAKEWRQAAASKQAALVPVRPAWSVYEASFIDSKERIDVVSRFPAAAKVLARYDGEIKKLTDRELAPIVADLRARIASRPTPGLHNRLGTTYARYGLFDKAEASFREAAKSDYPQAYYNLGNLKFMRKDYKGALSDYERSLRLNPDSVLSAIAVARAAFEQGDTKKALDSYRTASLLDPARAAEFAYVAGGASDTAGRAADAGVRAQVSWGE